MRGRMAGVRFGSRPHKLVYGLYMTAMGFAGMVVSFVLFRRHGRVLTMESRVLFVGGLLVAIVGAMYLLSYLLSRD
jgi:hypothetical membrane protein